jgi:hypothetical protein
MEELIYVCTWERSGETYCVWVKDSPDVRAVGLTFEGAAENLIETIAKSGGAHHSRLEFAPPAPTPKSLEKFLVPELFVIGGDTRFDIVRPPRRIEKTDLRKVGVVVWGEAFFSVRPCASCHWVPGPRNERQLELASVPSGFDGSFGSIGSGWAAPTRQIFSAAFLDLLRDDERGMLQFRSVSSTGRGRFFELMGPTGANCVALVGRRAQGWRCETCGHKLFWYQENNSGLHQFVASVDLPIPLPGLFTIGSAAEVQLVATAVRWEGLIGLRGTRGFVSRRLGVLPDSSMLRTPDLPPRSISPR